MNQIPFIGCINLLEREDRYNNSIEEFKKGGKYGCYDSHVKIYKKAIKNGVNNRNMEKTIKLALKCIKIFPKFFR